MIEALRQLAEQRPAAPPLESISDVPVPGASAVSAVRATASIETSPAAPSKTRRSRSRSRRPSEYYRSIAELGAAVAEALDHAHEQGIIHRDVKPSNLMLDGRGKVWVTDFGLARIEADTAMTMTGDLLGTLRYMSPEQAMAKRIVVDHRTDIYSLGVTLYELLTLRPAFDGESREEILRQIAFEEPTPPRRHDPNILNELETILLKAIEKNPADRYATAADLAADLRRYVADQPVKAKRPGAINRVGKWSRRHRAAVDVFAGVALLFAVAGPVVAVREASLRQGAAREAAIAQAVNDFLRLDLLEKAMPHEEADRDITLRAVLDRASANIADRFPNEPLVEAAIRETIGNTYRSLGEHDIADKHLRRATELYRAGFGDDDPRTLNVMLDLADVVRD